MLRSLVAWGDRWVSDEPPATLMHGDHELEQVVVCRHCGAEAPHQVSIQVNSPGWDVRGPAPESDLAATAAAWDAEYAAGRYVGEASGHSGKASGCAADGPGACPGRRGWRQGRPSLRDDSGLRNHSGTVGR